LQIETTKLIPADGVYAARAVYDGKSYPAALSIGTKPTMSDDGERTVEVLLIGFSGDLYGKQMSVECLRFLRPQEKFSSLDELKRAIANDVSVIQSLEKM
jgi:riboflavin kinase/FMN adenylyltransferase